MPSVNSKVVAGDGVLQSSTVSDAVSSLLRWTRVKQQSRPQLIADPRDDSLELVLVLRYVPSNPRPNKIRLLPLPHPPFLFDPSSISVCAIVDDRPNSASPSPATVLSTARSSALPIEESIGLSTLRTDYMQFEAKRSLARAHHLFVADRAILPLLPRLVGKTFYKTNRVPIPVDFGRSGWPEQIKRLLASTLFSISSGTCASIKVGRTGMKEEEIVENVIAAVEKAVELVPKNWDNVRSLHLKAAQSPALPVYQKVPEMTGGLRIPLLGLSSTEEKAKKKRKNADGGENGEKLNKKTKKRALARSIISEGGLVGNDAARDEAEEDARVDDETVEMTSEDEIVADAEEEEADAVPAVPAENVEVVEFKKGKKGQKKRMKHVGDDEDKSAAKKKSKAGKTGSKKGTKKRSYLNGGDES